MIFMHPGFHISSPLPSIKTETAYRARVNHYRLKTFFVKIKLHHQVKLLNTVFIIHAFAF